MADSNDSDEGGWEETGGEERCPCRCLFCSRVFDSGASHALEHCSKEHGFSLLDFIQRLDLEFYSCIKLINYIRKECQEPTALLRTSEPYPWLPDCYMIPAIVDDPLLQLDFEPSDLDAREEVGREGGKKVVDNLEKKLAEAESSVGHYKEALSRALSDLESMRHAVHNLVGEEPKKCVAVMEDKEEEEEEEKEEEEEGYFGSYTHFKIHEEMLKDKSRTETYRSFIEGNPELFKGKVVLDVGCGTGILSLLAASAGAKLVIGVDQSNIIYKAMDIIRENGYEEIVSLIKGKVEEVALPVDKVDIIISEWMGYFLLYESMLDTVLYARDKWLVDSKNVFPNSCSLSLAAMGNKWESKVQYWGNVYGFKMNCMKADVLREPAIEVIDHQSIISSSDTIKALVGYFGVGLEGKCPVHLNTDPHSVPTHWKQTVFYLSNPVPVHTGDLLKGKLRCFKNQKDHRSLDVTIQYELSSFHPDTKQIRAQQKFVLE